MSETPKLKAVESEMYPGVYGLGLTTTEAHQDLRRAEAFVGSSESLGSPVKVTEARATVEWPRALPPEDTP